MLVAGLSPSRYANKCVTLKEFSLGHRITGAERRKVYLHHYQKQWNANRDIGLTKGPYTRHATKAAFQRHKSARAHGITGKIFNEMLKAQSGVCAICERPETVTRKGKLWPLSIDHDHKTGKIRGLLCCNCNQALGKFKDNPDNLKRALEYLHG